MAAKLSVASAAVLRCRQCSHRFENPGAEPRCPECGAGKVNPVSVFGGAVEYALADRRQGYALEDIRFGKIAQWSELISPNQYNEMLNVQRTQPDPKPSLAELMLKKGLLTRRETEVVLRARHEAAESPDDENFGRIAMNNGLLTQAQFLKARQIQLELSAKGREVPPMPVVVYEKRYMQEKEISALLIGQAKKGQGLVAFIRNELSREEDTLTYRVLGPRGSSARKARIWGGIAAMAVVALVLYSAFVAAPEEIVVTRCKECARRFSAPMASEWPVECKNCSAMAQYPMAMCLGCGEEFMVENPASPGVKCPKCLSTNFQFLTRDLNVEELRRQMESGDGAGGAESRSRRGGAR